MATVEQLRVNLNLVDLDTSASYNALLNAQLELILNGAIEKTERETGLALTPKRSRIIVDGTNLQGTIDPVLIPKTSLKNPVNTYPNPDGSLVMNENYFSVAGDPAKIVINPDWDLDSTSSHWRIYPPDDVWPNGDEYHFIIHRFTNPEPPQITQAILVESTIVYEDKTDRSAYEALIESERSFVFNLDFNSVIIGIDLDF